VFEAGSVMAYCKLWLMVIAFVSADAFLIQKNKQEISNGISNGIMIENGINPIRKVVTLLQKMQKKVEEEGVKEAELFEKFQCYCKTSGATLTKSIEDADVKMPQLMSDIKEAESAKAQLQEELSGHQNDRDAAKAAMAKATEIREKEAAAFAKEESEDKAQIEALLKATAAIKKGMAGGFLQTTSAAVLRRFALNADISNEDRDALTSFLTGSTFEGGKYAPASGEIVGILDQMGDTMNKEMKDLILAEEEAKKAYDGLMEAKQKEVDAAIHAIEEKIKRIGELGIEIVNLKEDLDDTTAAFMEDTKFLADLKKNCGTKEKEWAERQKTRQEELLAIADTIKILNDDDALELFKKTVPSASLLQVQVSTKSTLRRALQALRGDRKRKNVGFDLIALAMQGRKVDFSKVLKMIDEMVVLLGKEQQDDDHKKEYCEKMFDVTDDKKKELERSISDLEKSIDEDKELVATVQAEIDALKEGIVKLDREVAEATEIRKDEHEDYASTLAANKAAAEIIEFAKNRMNKFYNPKLYKPPPKKETPELFQERFRGAAAPPPPPETFEGGYKKKGEESGGVIAMMDTLKADLEKEITEMEVTEKNAQEDYEGMVKDAAEKRASDTLSIEEKEAAKAGSEADLVRAGEAKAGTEDELMATKEYIADLHGECDWLLSNYGTRKEARAAEVDGLKNAKAVLSGADFSFVQLHDKDKHLK